MEKLSIEETSVAYIDYAIDEFCCSLKEDRLPECNITDNIKTFASICAAIESSRTGKNIDLSEFVAQKE